MKNREQLKEAFERFPRVVVFYTDGERIYANAVDGAKKVSRKEVFEDDAKAKVDDAKKVSAKADADAKANKTKTK